MTSKIPRHYYIWISPIKLCCPCRSLMETKMKTGTTLIVDRCSYSGVTFSFAKGLDIEWCKVKDLAWFFTSLFLLATKKKSSLVYIISYTLSKSISKMQFLFFAGTRCCSIPWRISWGMLHFLLCGLKPFLAYLYLYSYKFNQSALLSFWFLLFSSMQGLINHMLNLSTGLMQVVDACLLGLLKKLSLKKITITN